MNKVNLIRPFLISMGLLLSLGFSIRAQNTSVDSVEIYTETFEGLRLSIYSFKRGIEKEKGKIKIMSKNNSEIFSLKAFTKIDEVLKAQVGRDNYNRKFFSVIYRANSGIYFVAGQEIDGKWESRSRNLISFNVIDKSHQIKSISFAKYQPKVFKIEYKGSRVSPETFAEINGKIERIDCHTCYFIDQ